MSIDQTLPIKVLVSSYACGPNWGSEVGMGWNWVIHLAEYVQLFVITEKEFQVDIEKELPYHKLKYVPKFFYIDIGVTGRQLFWKQGSFSFYRYYKEWQKKAYQLSGKILQEQEIDLIHQLNLIGFREPGYLWKFGSTYPYIWGPIGGINQIPVNYILGFTPKNLLFYLGKNAVSSLQLSYLPRVKKALKASAFVISESSNTKSVLERDFQIKSVVIHETAGHFREAPIRTGASFPIKLIWIGKIQGTKALPIALKALAKLNTAQFHLTIIGDGPDEDYCKRLSIKLRIQQSCSFIGKTPNKVVIEKLKESDMLFFTSLKEGTSTVVLEALSEGVPVLCHDTCGFGDIVNDKCGVKIPLVSHKLSIFRFAEELREIARDISILEVLSQGALRESENLSWKRNASRMMKIYQNALESNKR